MNSSYILTIMLPFLLLPANTTNALRCFECTSYNLNCGPKIIDGTMVPKIPCGQGNYCFTKIDTNNVIYRGCTDRFYIHGLKNLWSKKDNQKWCNCSNEDYCNIDNQCGVKYNIIKAITQTTITASTRSPLTTITPIKTTSQLTIDRYSKCSPWSCFNSGLCLELNPDYSVCVCAPGFTGTNCETRVGKLQQFLN